MISTPKHFGLYNDEELMVLLTQGEVEAFDELYRRYADRLMYYFTRMFNYNKADAEDALHDLFLKLVQNPQRFDAGRSFKTWIFSIASNQCKNYYRHQEVVKKSVSELGKEVDWQPETRCGTFALFHGFTILSQPFRGNLKCTLTRKKGGLYFALPRR